MYNTLTVHLMKNACDLLDRPPCKVESWASRKLLLQDLIEGKFFSKLQYEEGFSLLLDQILQFYDAIFSAKHL